MQGMDESPVSKKRATWETILDGKVGDLILLLNLREFVSYVLPVALPEPAGPRERSPNDVGHKIEA